MHPYLNIANRAARSAGNLIARAVERLDLVTVSEKGQNDLVTDIDQQAEKIIVDTIRKAYPDHGILGEEGGSSGNDETVWIIDPIDGTTNFAHGFPHFSISIAIQHKGRVEHGLIFDPLRHETFTVTRGAGVQLNNRRLRIGNRPSLQGALIGTGFPYKEFHNIKPYMHTLQNLMEQAGGIRRAGSAALDLAYVAAGRLDGFWESSLAIWDIAAGALMVQEAGGLVSDYKGGEDYLTDGSIIAANPKIFKLLLQAVHAGFSATK